MIIIYSLNFGPISVSDCELFHILSSWSKYLYEASYITRDNYLINSNVRVYVLLDILLAFSNNHGIQLCSFLFLN
jgi:hypothetical protein